MGSEELIKKRFVIRKDIDKDYLELYTFEDWERQSAAVKSQLNFFNIEHMQFWKAYMRNREIVEFSMNQDQLEKLNSLLAKR
jgi:hypothetical protein